MINYLDKTSAVDQERWRQDSSGYFKLKNFQKLLRVRMHSLYFPMRGSHAPVREQPLWQPVFRKNKLCTGWLEGPEKMQTGFRERWCPCRGQMLAHNRWQRIWAFEKGRKQPQQSHGNQKAPREVGHRWRQDFQGPRAGTLKRQIQRKTAKSVQSKQKKNLTCLIFMCTPHPKISTHQEDGLSFISVVCFTKTIGTYFHFEDKKFKC